MVFFFVVFVQVNFQREDLIFLKTMHSCDDCKNFLLLESHFISMVEKSMETNEHCPNKKYDVVIVRPNFECISTRNFLRHVRNQHSFGGYFNCSCFSAIFGVQLLTQDHSRTFHTMQSNSQVTRRLNISKNVSSSAIKTAI